jgi:hypothetical protein
MPNLYGPMPLPRKFVAKTPKKMLTKKPMIKTRKFYFLAEIFDIFHYIRIARQFKNDFHYSNLHFGHLEISQQRFFMYSRESKFIHNTVPYRSVPYRTLPFSVTIFITLAVS